MKFMQSLWWLASLMALPAVAAQSSSVSVLSGLPDCAMDCFTKTIPMSSCSTSNQTCFCTNEDFITEMKVCVRKACTVRQSLYTQNLTSIACDLPVRDRSRSYRTLISVMLAISTVCVVQRMIYKHVMRVGLSTDDWVLVFQLMTVFGSFALQIQGLLKNGFGKDIYTLTPEQITSFLMSFQISSALYFIQITLLKISLLFFYLRIFPTPIVRHLLWGTIVFSALYGLVYTFTTIFVCSPVSASWKSWDGEVEGKCLNLNLITTSSSAISVAVDIWMLVIPLAQLKALNLDWKKKVFTAVMFCGGTCFTLVSILRLRSAQEFSSVDQNPTWNYMSISHYSALEINIGIVCACLPSIRIFFTHMFTKTFGKQSNTTNALTKVSDRQFQKRKSGADDSIFNDDSISDETATPERVHCPSFRTSHSHDDTDEVELVQYSHKTC